MSETNSQLDCCIIAAVNNDEVLAMNLADSDVFKKNSHYLMRDYSSASKAYNAGIDESEAEIMIFAHQDVYFPNNWFDRLAEQITIIGKTDKNWAVIGVYGVEQNGNHIGHCWSSGLSKKLGENFSSPYKICSIDELVIIIRRSSEIRFDEGLPGFHLYGTDIVQTAKSKNYFSYVINAPVIHNSKPVINLFGGYTAAYLHMRNKWKSSLPLVTVIVKITDYGIPLLKQMIKMFINYNFRKKKILMKKNSPHGSVIAKNIGFE